MADDKAPRKSEEQEAADRRFAETKPAHPVIAAAEEKLAAVEAGEYVDVGRHQEIRRRHLGETALTPEQRMTGSLGSEEAGTDNG
jgi:hypothetical protein